MQRGHAYPGSSDATPVPASVTALVLGIRATFLDGLGFRV